MKPLSLDKPEKEILNCANIGLEFEMYTLLPKDKAVESLEKATGKKIKWINQYHSEFVPTDKTYKLEPDFSGGMKMTELITGPLPYSEFVTQLKIIYNWIEKNGWTDEKCAMQVNISFDKYKIITNSISKINRLKFCLEMDEDFVLAGFEERKKSLYARSIKTLIPINRWIYSENTLEINDENWILPNEKYYGVNFTKRLNDYLEFRYMGGRDYEKKYKRTLENSNYFILFLYSILQNPTYTEENKKELKLAIKNNRKVSDSFSDLESFLLNWKKIQLLVNLTFNSEVVKAFWNIIRDKLFDIIMNSKFTKGNLNYDTDRNVFQLNEGKVTSAYNLRDIEFFNCEINGIFYNCEFYNCRIANSHLHECKVWNDNTITRSKIMESSIEDETNIINNCYIDNKKKSIKGTLNGGIIRSGVISKEAIKNEVEIINMKQMKQDHNKK